MALWSWIIIWLACWSSTVTESLIYRYSILCGFSASLTGKEATKLASKTTNLMSIYISIKGVTLVLWGTIWLGVICGKIFFICIITTNGTPTGPSRETTKEFPFKQTNKERERSSLFIWYLLYLWGQNELQVSTRFCQLGRTESIILMTINWKLRPQLRAMLMTQELIVFQYYLNNLNYYNLADYFWTNFYVTIRCFNYVSNLKHIYNVSSKEFYDPLLLSSSFYG